MRAFTILVLVLSALTASAELVSEMRVYATGGKSMTNWHGQAGVIALNLEMTREWSPRWDYGVIVSPMTIRQPKSWFGNDYGDGNENVNAIGSSLLVRRNFRVDDSRWRAFAELSSGPLYAEKRVPADTSRFNFASQGAVGVILRPDSAAPVILGYRFMHISNGGYASRNPGLNVSSLMIGTTLRFGARRR